MQRHVAKILHVHCATITSWELDTYSNISARNYYNIIQFLKYSPIETIPKTTGAQIFFYRKHAGITRKQLAEKIGTSDTEIKLWEKENFLVECCGFGFTEHKQQKLKTALNITKLVLPERKYISENLSPHLTTIGQHLRHRRKMLNLSRREVQEIAKLKHATYSRWENDTIQRVSPEMLVQLVAFLGYCPIETFTTQGQQLELYRRYSGLGQRQLAELLDCVPKTIYHWECGRWTLSNERKKQLKKILNIEFIP